MREVTEPVALCTSDGRVEPAAVGWSRQPLQRCVIPGHWGRRKRWHHWAVTTREHLVTITFADLDYLGLAAVYFLDFASGRETEKVAVRPLGWGVPLPDDGAGGEVRVRGMGLELTLAGRGGHTELRARARGLEVDLRVTTPPGHESLNVVVPFPGSAGRAFQMTSKQSALPAEGEVRALGRSFAFGAHNQAFAHLDFGRGVWPRRTIWNWAAGSGLSGGHTIGLNFGARWTDGSGVTENGVIIDGRLTKLGEVAIRYDRRATDRPWRLGAEDVDLTFTPFGGRRLRLELGLAAARLDLRWGRYAGRVLGHELESVVGWAEEFRGRW
jgi:hypothetical protein